MLFEIRRCLPRGGLAVASSFFSGESSFAPVSPAFFLVWFIVLGAAPLIFFVVPRILFVQWPV